jgi:hypothetical protein
MPLSIKQNVSSFTPSTVLISAEDYNLHDSELRAVEEYLGKVGGFVGLGLPKGDIPNLRIFQSDAGSSTPDTRGVDSELPDVSQGNLLNSIAKIVDVVNNVTGYAAQGSSSGYIHSGQRIILPENIHATHLTSTPGTYDTIINVDSTKGFPRQGVISILNDVRQGIKNKSDNTFEQNVLGGTSCVEWIRYSNKTDKQFTDCERGFINSTQGSHTGSFNATKETSVNKNQRDSCVLLNGLQINICSRQWPWWRQRKRYRISFFSIQGSWRDLVTFIVIYGARSPLSSSTDPSSANLVIKAANDNNLLIDRNGVPFLQSQDSSNVENKRIGWVEAEAFVTSLVDAGVASEITSADDFTTGRVPVFAGRLAVNYGVAALTRVSTQNIDAIQILQTADARVFCFMADTQNVDRTLQAIVNFDAYFTGPVMTSELRNNI